MKVACVSRHDHSDISKFSGSLYYQAKCLADSGLQLDYISNFSSAWELAFDAKTVLYRKILRKSYARHYQPMVLRSYARQILSSLNQIESDVIFIPGGGQLGATIVSYLQTDIPMVFWHDSTFAGVANFYHQLSNLSASDMRRCHEVEQRALTNCRLALYCSDWAARTAIYNYDVDPHKVKVVPFGANIECDRTIKDIDPIITDRDHNICKLLFVGVDWVRKGGDIALAVATELNARGYRTELHVVGCTPPEPTPDFVKLYGFVSKKSHAGRMLLNQLFAQSHFFILPTLADCFGVVFAEASSFGLPSLASQVGGVPTAVTDDQNGRTFPFDNMVPNMANYISSLMSDYIAYTNLCMRSFEEYESRLNWTVAGARVNQLLHEFCTV